MKGIHPIFKLSFIHLNFMGKIWMWKGGPNYDRPKTRKGAKFIRIWINNRSRRHCCYHRYLPIRTCNWKPL